MALYSDFLLPAVNFLRDVEMRGVVYDVNAAADVFENELNPEMQQRTKTMRDIIGNPLFSPASPQQRAALYYDTWQIKHAMQHRPGRDFSRSVDDSARQEIADGRFTCRGNEDLINVFNSELARWAKLQKQTSNYIVGLVKRAIQDPEHRIYTSLNVCNTVTGRLSSTEPNLQNITRSVNDLPSIRNLFVASPGRTIVQADYSQAELRVIAALSGDVELTRIYVEGLDLHSEVATMFHGENYTSEQRSKCKNMNFGVAYRQTAKTFQEKHKIPEAEGQKFIDWWWTRFTGVAKWEKGIETRIHKDGFLASPYGRRRRFHLLTKENVNAAYREGINFYPQSTASDCTLSAGIRLHREIDPQKAAIWLLVHDAINADVVEDYVDEYSSICRQVMESTAKRDLDWDIPFTCDIGYGASWGAAK